MKKKINIPFVNNKIDFKEIILDFSSQTKCLGFITTQAKENKCVFEINKNHRCVKISLICISGTVSVDVYDSYFMLRIEKKNFNNNNKKLRKYLIECLNKVSSELCLLM